MSVRNPYPTFLIAGDCPERMSAAERRSEIAALIVRGLLRLRDANAHLADTEGQFRLGFSGDQSVHVNPVNERAE